MHCEKRGEHICKVGAGAPHERPRTKQALRTARHWYEPSAYLYQPVRDHNCTLREKIIALAQRHRRYSAGMIYFKLR